MNKGPWRITFDTNPDDCNLQCIMCEEFSPYSHVKELRLIEGNTPVKRRMDINLIKKVIQEAKELGGLKEIIPSTMGEPLLYKDFDKIIDLCKTNDIKLNLTTNGTFPRKSTKEWAELIVPICSDVKISWNGATKETQEKIMKHSNFDKHLQNLETFIKIRDKIFNDGGNFCRVTLQVTFMKDNYREFPELIKMAAKLGVDRIKGHHLWTHFDEIKDQSMRKDYESIAQWNKIVDEMQIAAEKYRKPNGEKIILDNIYKLDEKSTERLLENSVCPFLTKEAWVAWDGRFNPCCAPDNERKKLGYFGNLKEQSLKEIWFGEKYLELVKNYKNNELCKNCNMRVKIQNE